MIQRLNGTWGNVAGLQACTFVCGNCNKEIASVNGWQCTVPGTGALVAQIFLCPYCVRPSFFEGATQIPGVAFGKSVQNVPPEVDALYEEARRCSAANAHTAAVLAIRKLLMHIAVNQGASPGQSFLEYVDHLSTEGYVPPGGKAWVDHIRKKGNEANHEIKLMLKSDAEELLIFTEMLLKFIYEFPSRIPKPSP